MSVTTFEIRVKADSREEACRAGIQAGFKSGWMAACLSIAAGLRKYGALDLADQVEAYQGNAPTPDLVAFHPGETIEDVVRRQKGERN